MRFSPPSQLEFSLSAHPHTNFAPQNADIQAIMSRKVNYITDHLEKDYDAIVEGFRIG